MGDASSPPRAPLYWFTALRPLSDMLGFAAAMWALALDGGEAAAAARCSAGALLAGLAIGIRSQTAVLTLPLLALALLSSSRRAASRSAPLARVRRRASLAWAVPLIVASGGLSAYLRALGSQAGEDFPAAS